MSEICTESIMMGIVVGTFKKLFQREPQELTNSDMIAVLEHAAPFFSKEQSGEQVTLMDAITQGLCSHRRAKHVGPEEVEPVLKAIAVSYGFGGHLDQLQSWATKAPPLRIGDAIIRTIKHLKEQH